MAPNNHQFRTYFSCEEFLYEQRDRVHAQQKPAVDLMLTLVPSDVSCLSDKKSYRRKTEW